MDSLRKKSINKKSVVLLFVRGGRLGGMNHVRVEAERSIKSAVVSNPPAAHKGEGSISACLKVVRQRLSPIGDSSPTDFRRLGFSRHGEDKTIFS